MASWVPVLALSLGGDSEHTWTASSHPDARLLRSDDRRAQKDLDKYLFPCQRTDGILMSMSEAPVQLKVAGQIYQVISSAPESELKRLAQVVERALYEVTQPGRQPSPQALVLAAMTLAHELEAERAEKDAIKRKYAQTLESLLGRVDQALDQSASFLEDEPAEVPALVKGKGRPTDRGAKR